MVSSFSCLGENISSNGKLYQFLFFVGHQKSSKFTKSGQITESSKTVQSGQTSIACSSHTFGDVLVIYSGNITTTSQHCSLEGATLKTIFKEMTSLMTS